MVTVSNLAGSLERASAAAMHLYTVDPLSDTRWDDLVTSHPMASVFRQSG